MVFSKFRPSAQDSGAASQPESVETLRRRAKHRLIGAAVLVLAGVMGFPLLFDTQPRPVAVNIAIDIPDKTKVKPLTPNEAALEVTQSAAPTVPTPAPAPPVVAAAKPASAPAKPNSVATAASLEPHEQVVSGPAIPPKPGPAPEPKPAPQVKAEPKHETKPEPKPVVKPEAPKVEVAKTKPDAKPEAKAKPDTQVHDAQRAQALLEGRDAPVVLKAEAVTSGERFIVQIGAFADNTKAQEVRHKVERSGMKTYTHVAETKEGKRTRVRVGPFATRAEADRAAEKLRGLGLAPAVLTI